MVLKFVIVLVLGLFLTKINCESRTDIINQYQPTLLSLKSFIDNKYKLSNTDYNILDLQIKNQIVVAKNQTNQLIQELRKRVAQAKEQKKNSTEALKCISVQEIRISRINLSPLNNVYPSINMTYLRNLVADLNKLSQVCLNTVSYCSYLNPLNSQNESLKYCLAFTITDLSRQTNVVQLLYKSDRDKVLNLTLKNLANIMAGIFAETVSINYEVNMCLIK